MIVRTFCKTLLVTLAVIALAAPFARADKPEWAGEGGKPTASEKEQHVEEMRSKNNGNKNKSDKNKKDKKDKKTKYEDTESSDWEKEKKKLEDNVRSNNRGMITDKPMN